MNGICGDKRFEIIAKVKKHLIEATNIERQPKELECVDNILFRLWQLGYFESLEGKVKSEIEIKFDISEVKNMLKQLERQVEDWVSDHEHNIELMKGLNDRIAELEKANEKANEWHYPSKGELPTDDKDMLMSKTLLLITKMKGSDCLSLALGQYNFSTQEFSYQHIVGLTDVIAWKEIVLPKESK